MSPQIVTREKWIEARKAHLEDEKAFTKARDALSARRRALPWVRVETDYQFQGVEGPRSLGDLFGPRSQLIVQHFMYGEDWEAGCTSCSFWTDGFDPLADHLAARDTALVMISNASIEKIEAYRTRMGWTLPWVSSVGTTFNRDFEVTFTPDEMADGTGTYNYETRGFPATEAPGISVFHKTDDGIFHTYSTYARGLDMLNAAYHLMDLLPKGRDEGDGIMRWLRRHDEYES